MADIHSRFRLASAPVSWGIQDYPDPAWEQPYEAILDEMIEAGYQGTELGPYGYLPTDAAVLLPVLRAKRLHMLSSFVPVNLADAEAAAQVIEHIRKVGALLAALGAPCIVLADEQSRARESVAGRVPKDDSCGLNASQWRNVGTVAAEAEKVAGGFGLDLVFHPHVGTYVETPDETQRFFDAVSATNIGLCLDTGHCYYGGGDPVQEAAKYKGILRYVHVKDIDPIALRMSSDLQRTFEQAVESGVFSQVGAGCVDFRGFFETLSANGYSGWCVVEQDIKYGVTPVAPKDSMAASARYLHSVFEAIESSTRDRAAAN